MQVDSETKISNFAVSVTCSLFCLFGVSVSGRLDQTAHISVIFGRSLPLSLEIKTDIVTSSTSSEHY